MSQQFNNQYRVGQGGFQIVTQDASVDAGDRPRMVLVDASSAPVTLTLFSAEGLGGKELRIMKTDSSSNPVTIAGLGSQTINGVANVVISAQFGFLDLISDNVNQWFAIGSSTGGTGIGGGLLEQVALVEVVTPATTVDIPFTSIDLNGTFARIVLYGIYKLSVADTVNYRFDDRNDGDYETEGANTTAAGVHSAVNVTDSDGFTSGISASSTETNIIELEVGGTVKINQAQGQLEALIKERLPNDGTFYGGGFFNTQESAIASFNVRSKNQIATFLAGSKFQVYVQKYA